MLLISIQGIPGSFHHEAASLFFKNQEWKLIPCSTFRLLAKSVYDKNTDFGVMAIENSIAGGILPNYNLINQYNLKIIGEIILPIHHHLLSLPSDEIDDIKEVRTHPMAFLQCSNFLEKYPDWILLEKDDTATCAKNINLHQMRGTAGIGSLLAAELYHLKLLKKNIHDVSNNYTRFYIIANSDQLVNHKDYNKASLYFSTDHSSGSLAKVLDIFSKNNINLTHIQSVPLPGTLFEYSFHVDIFFNNPENYHTVIEKIKLNTGFLKILGEYKQHENNYLN